MSTQAKVTATVEYRQDESSYRAVAARTKAMGEEYRKIVDRSNGQAAAAARVPVDPTQRMRVSMDGLTRSTLTANTAMMKGKEGATQQGMAMLMLSQAVDDAQYGFKGIVNNIAPLVMSLGGSAGLAGVLTVGAVGFNLLSGSMDKWTGAAQRAKAASDDQSRSIRRANEELESARRHGEARAERIEKINQGDREFQTKQVAASQRTTREEEQRFAAAAADAAAPRAGESGNAGELAAMRRVHGLENRRDAEAIQARMGLLLGGASANSNQRANLKTEIQEMERRVEELRRGAGDRTARIAAMRDEIRGRMQNSNINVRMSAEGLRPALRDEEARMNELAELEPVLPQKKQALAAAEGRWKELQEAALELRSDARIADGARRQRGAVEQRKQAEIFRENAERWGDGMNGMRERFAEWSVEMSRALTVLRQEMAARRETLRHLEENNRIDKLRLGGHSARAERAESKENRRRRTQEILDQGLPGMTPERAEEIARDEDNTRRGLRKIRRVEGDRTPRAPSALDAFDFRQRGGAPQFPSALDEARRDRAQRKIGEPVAQQTNGAGPGSGGRGAQSGGGIGELLQIIKEIRENTSKTTQNTEKTGQSRVANADK